VLDLPDREQLRTLRARAPEHRLGVHASSIAFQVLVGLVPLALLGIALLGAFGLESTWYDSVGPELRRRLSLPVYGAIDFSVTEIFTSAGWSLIAFAGALLVWQLWRGVLAASAALNDIRETRETRPLLRRTLVTLTLAVVVGVCLIGATLTMVVASRVAGEGTSGLLVSLARFPLALVLVGVSVGLLLRYAGATSHGGGWASVGSVVIVVGWILLSLGFGWWVTSVADYKSAFGNLAVFLVLAAYVLAASAIFLLGAELDELGGDVTDAEERADRSGRGRSSSGRQRRRR